MTQFTYEATREDFLRLNRMLYWRQLRMLIVFAVVSLFLFVVFPFLAVRSPGILESYSVAWIFLILPGLVGFSIFALERAARKRWQDAAEIRASREYTIDDAGIHVKSATFNGFLAWEHLNEWKEAGGFLYLRTTQGQYYFFPFALVPDPAALRALVAAKVKPAAAAKGKGFGYKVSIVWLVIVVVAVIIALLPNAGSK
jgi:hypothetical protein